MRAICRFPALALALALAGGACVPVALPPAMGSVGVIRDSRDGGRTGVTAELGISPLQLIPGQVHRVWDVGLAGTYAHTARDTWGAALYAGPILHPWGDDPASRTTRRLVPQLVGRVTTDGNGLGIRVSLEDAGFARGSGIGRDAALVAYGEGAYGAYAEVTATQEADRTTWAATVGVSLRIPALAGIVCCADL